MTGDLIAVAEKSSKNKLVLTEDFIDAIRVNLDKLLKAKK